MKNLLYYLGIMLLLLLFELILGIITFAISYAICNFFALGTGALETIGFACAFLEAVVVVWLFTRRKI